MVFLSKIYTKSGDAGETSLGDGRRVPEDHPRIVAVGDVDELNSAIGTLMAHNPGINECPLLLSIQNDLFDVGADLCVPLDESGRGQERLRVLPGQVDRLEKAIDRLNEPLPPLTSFVLPGGTPASAGCHFARAVCRRAERSVIALARTERINTTAAVYLNRLSDFLFVLARVCNTDGDLLWKPGENT